MPTRLSKFRALPRAAKSQLLQGFLAVAFFRVALAVVGYKKASKLIRPASNAAAPELAADWGWCISQAAKIVPGAACLAQAMALQFVLARHGYRSDMRIGVGTDPQGGFLAHAWLLSEGRVLIGGDVEKLKAFTPLVDLRPTAR